MNSTIQKHWDEVYATKGSEEVSWTQAVPKTSLEFIHSSNLPKTAKIIDVGGGNSTLVDFLLEAGFQHITVLDISGKALAKAKQRLGNKAGDINWVVCDITQFDPVESYDLWHDRATFHFLTEADDINKYLDTARKSINGFMTLGTFSEHGPEKCSGLPIARYNEESLSATLHKGFRKIRCLTEDHTTPFNTQQNFLFCSFRRQEGGSTS